MLQDSLDTSESLNHIGSVVVKIPEFTIMFLMGPPKRILLQKLILLELLPDSPPFIICKSESIFLEQSVDPGNTVIP